ncbi:NHR-86 protein, partial [Aphelenchoides avenae]
MCDDEPTSYANSSPETGGSCEVCGDETIGKQFGANACRACAAFFRRTVAGRRQYVCRGNRDCFSTITGTVRGSVSCKHCRFQRCLQIGMQITGKCVRNAKIEIADSVGHDGSPLGKIVAFRNAMYLRRIKTSVEAGIPQNSSYQWTTKTTMN